MFQIDGISYAGIIQKGNINIGSIFYLGTIYKAGSKLYEGTFYLAGGRYYTGSKFYEGCNSYSGGMN